jgi:SNF2 family DNA or RNA helicase
MTLPALFVYAESDSPFWLLRTSHYSKATTELAGMIPRTRWDRSRGMRVGYPDAIRALVSALTSAGARVMARPESLPPEQIEGPAFAPRALVDPPADFRDYQITGAEWLLGSLLSTRAGLLADEMGLGKTAQAIVAGERALPTGGFAQVVAPAIVCRHWEAQIERWTTGSLEWEVTSYEKFARALAKGRMPYADLLVIDEIHYAMNSATKRSKALAAWLGSHEIRPLVIGLSGTPMNTRLRDLHHPLSLLWPDRFGTFFAFTRRYCEGHYEEIPGLAKAIYVTDGRSHEDELTQRLRDCMLRRTKADVQAELPPLTREVVEIPLAAGARRTLAAAARAIDWDRGESGQALMGVLSACEDSKLPHAIELAREVIESGGTPLVLTLRKRSAWAIAQALGCTYVTGDVPADRRQEVLTNPVGDGTPPIAGAATIQSVTTGIPLVEFDTVIFVGLDWTPSTILQAEARPHRLGQKRSVQVFYLVALGTVDEIVRQRVIERLDLFATVTSAPAGDEAKLASALGGGEDEDSLLSSLVEAVRKEVTHGNARR